MRWGPIIGSTFIALLIISTQWPKLQKNQKKEKVTIILITAIGWVLSILLFLFPDLPGPTQLVDQLFRPLGQMIE